MKKTCLFFILVFFMQMTYGQVETKFYPEKDALEQVSVMKNHPKAGKTKQLPAFDIQELIKEDEANKGLDIPFRFGKGFDTDITLSDGEWVDVENGRLWSMEFESERAYSINFVFEDFYLPDKAELYISNKEGSMLYGPVTSKQNTKNGYFLTDLVKGDKVNIYLFEPLEKTGQALLTIKRVVHAYKNLFGNIAYGNLGASESCNNDIACFSDWDMESDAVALVLLANGTEWCSGSLLMTANQNFRPYFLSAFHCIDTSSDGNLSTNEISNAENWLFKFQYKKAACNGSAATTGITYNGAVFRAAWNNTDFALMEMSNSPVGDTRFSWLGWDRSGNTPTSGTGIHHPSGDVMKISFDNDQFQRSTWGAPNNHWLLNFDDGVVEHGSSGSPILDQNNRIVGQLHGNQNYIQYLIYCSQHRAEYGQFHRSWTGGGTNTTRLSNWLDPANSGVLTTNTSRTPTLSGPSTICTTGTYSINNLPTGVESITWSHSSNMMRDEFIFIPRTAESSSVSVENTLTLVKGISPRMIYPDYPLPPLNLVTSEGWVQARVTINGNTILLPRYNITVGTPPAGIKGPMPLNSDIIIAPSAPGYFRFRAEGVPSDVSDNNIRWVIASLQQGSNGHSTLYLGRTIQAYIGEGMHEVRLQWVGGACGNSIPASLLITSIPMLNFSVYPNPATDLLTIELTADKTESGIATLSQTSSVTAEPYTIQLWHERLGLVRSVESTESVQQISLQGLPAGTYFVLLIIDGETVGRETILKR